MGCRIRELGEVMGDRPDGKLRQFLWFAGWPLRQLLILGVRGYKKFISPGLPSSCRYYPSCSTYAVQSLQRHGVFKGLVLASWRILKCNPFTEGGVNPIPEKGKWRSAVGPDGEPRSYVGSDGETQETASKSKTDGNGSPGDPNEDPVAKVIAGRGQTRPTTISTLGV